jgi:hypothetical protein
MRAIPFIGGSYEDRSKDVNAQRTVNLYPVLDQEGGKTISLYPTPGTQSWLNLGVSAPIRGMYSLNEYLYVVAGNKAYKINESKASATMTGTLNSSTGLVKMVANSNEEIMIIDSDYGYYISGANLSQITDADFVNPSDLAYQDGYAIVTEDNSGRFWISGINDFSSWSALDYGSAETLPDDVLACVSDHRELWLMGRKTLEPFSNTGNIDFPFERISSAVQEIGVYSSDTVTKLDNSIYFLDNWGQVRRLQSYTPVVISTGQVGYRISTYDWTGAFGIAYTHENRSFYCLTFPLANNGSGATECYDVSTGMWHQRASGSQAPNSSWRPTCTAYFDGQNLFGDSETGQILELNHDVYTDVGVTIPAVRRGLEIFNDRDVFTVSAFELDIERGVGTVTDPETDPQAMLRYSKDGGKTWSNELWRDIGEIGEYNTRVRWTRLGRCRRFLPEVTITDPVNRVITGAYINGVRGTS